MGIVRIAFNNLAPFKEICRKICLNIPATYRWHWDSKRDMAVLTLSVEDAELAFFPLFKEFIYYWNFTSTVHAEPAVSEIVNAKLGLMPGQTFFSSQTICNLVLFAAWWPWGEDSKVSMRVGLISINGMRLPPEATFQCLSRWLNISS